MVDPISIAGLSLQVVQILAPIVKALRKAYGNGKTVHQSLQDLHSDLIVIYELTGNIHRLFNVPSFVRALDEVHTESNVNLVHSLDRALQSCAKGAQDLRDILSKFGLQTPDARLKQAYLQWRLDRRLDDIDRLKRNFQDYKSAIQLAFQVLTTCKQLQTADRDARHAAQLKAQLDTLQTSIQQIAQQITIRQAVPSDEEQTKLLDDMKDMQIASVSLQRRATQRLEYLTSLDTWIEPSPIDQDISSVPSTENDMDISSHSPMPEHGEIQGPSSADGLNLPSTPGAGSLGYEDDSSQSIASRQKRPGPTQFVSSDPLRSTSPPSSSGLTQSPRIMSASDTSISAEEFERGITALLASATSQRMGTGTSKPYSDDFMVRIANMLAAVGKRAWSERPRLYLVLRLINQVKTMDIFILEGFKDIDFPYTGSTLPGCIQAVGAQHDFLHYQRYVLSARSADLVSGGRHHHLDKSADVFFMSLQKLGSGGFSIVDKVRSRLSLQDYARKRIDRNRTFAKDRKALDSFENEVHNLKRLSHHHLVKFVGSYTDKKYIGIIMQPVADIDLHGYLSKTTWTSEDLYTLRTFVGCLCSALNYLHQNKCRHKDLKPQNVLIKGSNVFIADFGTAFDWSESQSDITIGPPEAFTKLYVAPEVALHQPRDTSSDIWSLGCIFLEIATVLSGNSLQSKSSYFAVLETPSTAYWQNHEAIASWIILIRHASGNAEAPLFEWIESMTTVDRNARPSAENLLAEISTAEHANARYGRSCCFEDFDSDATSWAGSVTGDDIFETARGITDVTSTTAESIAIPPTVLEKSLSTEDPSFSNKNSTLALRSSSITPQESNLEDGQRSIVTHPERKPPALISPDSKGLDKPVESTQHSATSAKSKRPPQPASNSTPQDDAVGRPPGGKHQTNLHQTTSTLNTVLSSLDSHFPVPATQEDRLATIEVENVFLESHQRLENLLITARRQNPNWLSHLSSLVEKSIVDSRGFNILVVASKFNNFALAMDVVEAVVKEKSELVNQTDLFKNSALHYATCKGRVKMIKLLINSGATAYLQNSRGQTALHLAAWSGQTGAIRALLPHLTLDQVDICDHHGKTPLRALSSATDDAKIVHEMVAAGADPNSKDGWGYNLIQNAKFQGQADKMKALLSLVSPNSSEGMDVQMPPFEEQLARCKGLAMPDCFCEVCLFTNAVRSAGDAISRESRDCLCPNHLQKFVKDTLSTPRHASTTLRVCLCERCVSIREYNTRHAPCGLPFRNDYSPYTDNPRIALPFTEPPTLPLATDFANKPIPPYPGHQYYDRLIDEHLSSNITRLSRQEVMTIVLQSLADAGFKGQYSYRKYADNALKWVIRDYENIMHVTKTVEVLLDCGASLDTMEGNLSLLRVAAREQDLMLMQLLLDRNALKSDAESLRMAIERNKPLSAHMLLRAGPLLSHTTYLHSAIQKHVESWALPMLFGHGARMDLKDSEHNKALHIAVSQSRLHAVTVLLESGSPLDERNKGGETPLALALKQKNSEIVSTLLMYGARLDTACGDGPCALFEAILKSDSEIIYLLLDEYNAAESIGLTDDHNSGILHYLAWSKQRDSGLMDVLLGYDQPLELEDKWGQTPLHRAAFQGNITLVKKLLERGAVMHPQSHNGQTPLDMAQRKEHREVVECLGGTFQVRKGPQAPERVRKPKRWWRLP